MLKCIVLLTIWWILCSWSLHSEIFVADVSLDCFIWTWCLTAVYHWQVWLGDLANEMKDTLTQLLVDCLSASKKGGSGGGVDPSKFPSQVCLCFWIQCDCWSISLSVRPFVCPSICLSVHLSVRPSVHPSVCPSVRLSICPSVSLSISPSVSRSVSQWINESNHSISHSSGSYITAPFNNMRNPRFKSAPTVAYFAAVNHI